MRAKVLHINSKTISVMGKNEEYEIREGPWVGAVMTPRHMLIRRTERLFAS